MSSDQGVYFLLWITLLIIGCTALHYTALIFTFIGKCVRVCVCVPRLANPNTGRQCISIEPADTNSATPVCARSLTPTRTHTYSHRSLHDHDAHNIRINHTVNLEKMPCNWCVVAAVNKRWTGEMRRGGTRRGEIRRSSSEVGENEEGKTDDDISIVIVK